MNWRKDGHMDAFKYPDQQRCRSVVKYGGQGQSGQAIKPFQVPWKISFTFHFWHNSFILDDASCRVIQQPFWKTEYVILEGQNILWPLLHISGIKTRNPPESTPCWLTSVLQSHKYNRHAWLMQLVKKALRETQTLHVGCSKAEPKKILPRCRPPSRGHRTAKV